MRLLAAVEYPVQVREGLVPCSDVSQASNAQSLRSRRTEEDDPAEILPKVDVAYREGIDIGEKSRHESGTEGPPSYDDAPRFSSRADGWNPVLRDDVDDQVVGLAPVLLHSKDQSLLPSLFVRVSLY